MLLHGFAQRADKIGADERVLPSQSCRMTSVVHDRSQAFAGVVNDLGHQGRIVGDAGGIEAADELVAPDVEKVSVRGEITAARAIDNRCRSARMSRGQSQLRNFSD